MEQPDEIDWKIIRILRNGNKSNNSIARTLGISEGTVRKRIKRLKDAKIIDVRGLINPSILDDYQIFVVCVNISDSKRLLNIADEIADLENVLNVSVISGRYNLFVEVLITENYGIVDFITQQLSKVEGISKIETFLVLSSCNKFI